MKLARIPRTDPDTLALETGRKVLAALERGRLKVLAARRRQHDALADIIEREWDRDAAAGKREYARATRIARRLKGLACERTIFEICAEVRSRRAEKS
jgi:hypothetical protein